MEDPEEKDRHVRSVGLSIDHKSNTAKLDSPNPMMVSLLKALGYKTHITKENNTNEEE